MDEKLEFKLTSYSLVLISEVIAKSKRDYAYFKETSASLFKKNWFKEESIEESNRKKSEIIAANMYLLQVSIFQAPENFDLKDVDIKKFLEVKTKLSNVFFDNLSASFDIQLLTEFIKANTRHEINELRDWLPLIPISLNIYSNRLNDYQKHIEGKNGIDYLAFSRRVYSCIFEKEGALNVSNIENNLLFSNGGKVINSFCVDIAKQQAIIDSK